MVVNFHGEIENRAMECISIWTFEKKKEREKKKGWQAAIIKWSDIFVIEFDWKSFSESFDLRNDRPAEDGD